MRSWRTGRAKVAAGLRRVSQAQGAELPAAMLSFACFFCLLAAYYVLRPLRDEMGIQQGSAHLPSMFSAVFLSMLVLVPVFGWLTRRFPRRRLLPWVYGFFALNLLGFCELLQAHGAQRDGVARGFFVWVSVFNLFAISVFWSHMADLFRTGQAHRLYGFISAGGTLGALCGPVLTVLLVPWLGAKGLVLVSGGLLAACVVLVLPLGRWVNPQPPEPLDAGPGGGSDEAQGFQGSLWSGLTDVWRSPYLRGICAFLLLYSVLSTLLYFLQADLMPASFKDPTRRTQMLAGVDFLVNGVTLGLQLLAFGPLIRRLGTRLLLVAMPVASVLGYAALTVAPAVAVLLAFGVVRRAGEYAISKPTRETLFNALPPAQKYRAKNVIDTLVHRTGDTASAWLVQGLQAMGLVLTHLTGLGLALGALWFAVAWRLGGQAERLQRERDRNAVTPFSD